MTNKRYIIILSDEGHMISSVCFMEKDIYKDNDKTLQIYRIMLIVLPVTIIFITLVSLSLFNLSYAQVLTQNKVIILSNSTGLSTDGSSITSLSGKYVFSVWRSNINGNDGIFFRKSTDYGNTFGKIVRISNSTVASFEPKISADGNNVYFLWTDSSVGKNQVFFRKSTDYGNTFGKIVNLSNSTGQAGIERIISGGGSVYVAWRDNFSGNPDIFFRKSTDYGNTFGKPINISDDKGLSGLPQISSFGKYVYIAWQDTTSGFDNVYLRTSHDGGNTFANTINLSNNSNYSIAPKISVDANNVNVIWTERTPMGFHILFIQSTNNGNTFGKPLDLTQFANKTLNFSIPVGIIGPSQDPIIQSSQKFAYVVWSDIGIGNNEIIFVRISNNSTNNMLSKTINLSNNYGYSIQPDMTVVGNRVYIAWSDSTPGNHDILSTVSMDNGNTFANTINLSNDKGPSFIPFVFASETNGYVTWEDSSSGVRGIYATSIQLQK